MKPIVFDSRSKWEVTEASVSNEIIYSNETKFIGNSKAKKYWNRRYEYWPNFDDGICTDETGLFSVTPWDAAVQIARTLDASYPKDAPTIVDFGCGVGGNVSAFARVSPESLVLGVDIDSTRIVCAKRNAEVCNLKNANFVKGDGYDILPMLRGSIRYVFSSPPWGGPGYHVKCVEDIEIDLFKFADVCKKACPNDTARFALMLPRQFPIKEAKRLAAPGTKMAAFDITTGPQNRVIAKCFLYGLKPTKK